MLTLTLEYILHRHPAEMSFHFFFDPKKIGQTVFNAPIGTYSEPEHIGRRLGGRGLLWPTEFSTVLLTTHNLDRNQFANASPFGI